MTPGSARSRSLAASAAAVRLHCHRRQRNRDPRKDTSEHSDHCSRSFRPRPDQRPAAVLRVVRHRRDPVDRAARGLRHDRNVRRPGAEAGGGSPRHRGRPPGSRPDGRHRPPAEPGGDGRRHRRPDRLPGSRTGGSHGLFAGWRRGAADGDRPSRSGQAACPGLDAVQQEWLVPGDPGTDEDEQPARLRVHAADPDVHRIRRGGAESRRLSRPDGQDGGACSAGTTTGRRRCGR